MPEAGVLIDSIVLSSIVLKSSERAGKAYLESSLGIS